ncbi:MAG: metallophosphoesterase [Lentimicrobiaceae bacterium]|jgi:hypothetical protein|nr:metallophosphoesterase [Lentimicrobiaceae bacterium]
MKKNTIYKAVTFVVLAIFIGIVSLHFPKYTGRYLFFLLFFLFDLYYWSWWRTYLPQLEANFRKLVSILFWVPISLLLVFFGASSVYPYTEWNIYIWNYALGLIFSLYLARFIPYTFLFLNDIVRLFIKLWHRVAKGEKYCPKRFDRWITIGSFLNWLFFVTLVMGMVIGAWVFKVKKETIYVENLPKTFNGWKIVQISDIHLGNWIYKGQLERAVKMINDQHPDLVLFTGDMVNYSTRETIGYESILAKISAKHGIYAVLGNHDYGDYTSWKSPEEKANNLLQLKKFYKKLGWKLLCNQNDLIICDSDSLTIIGVENWSRHRRFQKRGNLSIALKGVEKVSTQFLLSHDPSHFDKEVSSHFPNIDLTLSGHTHGMQLGLCFGKKRISPAALTECYWGGLYHVKNQYLNVSCGLGTVGYPGRVGILPEINVIELRVK